MHKNKNEVEHLTPDIHMDSSNAELLSEYLRIQKFGYITDITRFKLLIGNITTEEAKIILVNELQRLETLGYEEYFVDLTLWQEVNREFSLGLDEHIIGIFGRELKTNEKNSGIYTSGIAVLSDDFKFIHSEELLVRGSEVIRQELSKLLKEYEQDTIDNSDIFEKLVSGLSFINNQFRHNKAQYIEIQKNDRIFSQLINTVDIKNLPIRVLNSCLSYGCEFSIDLQTQLINEASRRVTGLVDVNVDQDFNQERLIFSLIEMRLKTKEFNKAFSIFEKLSNRDKKASFSIFLNYAFIENDEQLLIYLDRLMQDEELVTGYNQLEFSQLHSRAQDKRLKWGRKELLFWWGFKAIQLRKQSYHFDNPNVIEAIKIGKAGSRLDDLINVLSIYPDKHDLRLLIEERIKHLLKTELHLENTIINLAYLRSIKTK